jgi:hypothetical protein
MAPTIAVRRRVIPGSMDWATACLQKDVVAGGEHMFAYDLRRVNGRKLSENRR